MPGGKNGRPSREVIRERKREAILSQLEELALDAAPDAMHTLAAAARLGEPIEVCDDEGRVIKLAFPPVPRERLDAAKYILDQVVGRPGQKAAPAPAEDAGAAALRELADLRAERRVRIVRAAADSDLDTGT